MQAFDDLWLQCRPAFQQERSWRQAWRLAVSELVALGRHTVTGMLVAGNAADRDWSGAFRMFERERLPLPALWQNVRREVGSVLPSGFPMIALVDDTRTHKRGRKVAGTSWQYDPLGPKFHRNLLWGHRVLEIAAVLPEDGWQARARAIPIDFCHAPIPKHPKRTASPEDWQAYKQARLQARLPVVAGERVRTLRESLDKDPQTQDRKLVIVVDGGYTNTTFLNRVPGNAVVIGRLRKDAKLFDVPEPDSQRRGRRKVYGMSLPTPEAYRQDDAIPWKTVMAYAAGKRHSFSVKVMPCVRWRGAGAQNMQVIIIRPLGYRPSPKHRILYRDPAYLLCTDPDMSLEQVLQAYLWRWEIEVLFREEKTILGLGEAQVRTDPTVEQVPAFVALCYAMLHLAAARSLQAMGKAPRPKWQKSQPGERWTTNQIIGRLRTELWEQGLKENLTDFDKCENTITTQQKRINLPYSAVVWAAR